MWKIDYFHLMQGTESPSFNSDVLHTSAKHYELDSKVHFPLICNMLLLVHANISCCKFLIKKILNDKNSHYHRYSRDFNLCSGLY